MLLLSNITEFLVTVILTDTYVYSHVVHIQTFFSMTFLCQRTKILIIQYDLFCIPTPAV